MNYPRLKLAAALLAVMSELAAQSAVAFESGRAGFSVTVNDDLEIPYEIFAIYVLPQERLEFTATADRASAADGELAQIGQGAWQWIAPAESGLSTLQFEAGDDRIRINAFVLHPASELEQGQLHGYRVGTYPAPLRGEAVYAAPDGFIELNETTSDVALSPNFRLDQFPSKQAGGLPKYLVLREHLLLKLELLLEHVNASGIETESFTVMSGFRTPVYNRAIGNGQHSRHIYGGAADIYIDRSPRDDIMDDLNGDGAFDFRDAQYLYRLADAFFARPENSYLIGGLGVYRSTAAHGPFLHVDARGFRARWGLLP